MNVSLQPMMEIKEWVQSARLCRGMQQVVHLLQGQRLKVTLN